MVLLNADDYPALKIFAEADLFRGATGNNVVFDQNGCARPERGPDYLDPRPRRARFNLPSN
jgi:hypothetical protein